MGKLLTGLVIKLLVRFLIRLVTDFLIVLVNELVNGLLSGFVTRILSDYSTGYVKDCGMGKEVRHSENRKYETDRNLLKLLETDCITTINFEQISIYFYKFPFEQVIL